MQIVKISFKTDKGKYEFFTNSEKMLSLLADDVFTDTIVNPKNGERINHGEEVEKILEKKKESPE